MTWRPFPIVLVLVLVAGCRKVDTTTTQTASGDHSYAVTMSPVGTVTFKQIPRRVVTLDANYNDMLVALGIPDRLVATGSGNNFYDGFYEQIGLEPIGRDGLTFLYGAPGSTFDKERFYALRADVHHIDPTRLASSRGWTKADVDEIAKNVGPFLANRYSRENSYPGKERYEYYGIWELSDKVAQVYKRSERVAALKKVADKMIAMINAKLPPTEKRPKVGLVHYSKGQFLPFSLLRNGFGQAQYVAVGARDAFTEIKSATYGDAGRGTRLDLEALIKFNPDVLIVPWAIYPASRVSYEDLVKLKGDPLGRHLNALKNGRVYPGGSPLQGPVFYLFQVEMAAKQIYPGIFGPYRDNHQYPEDEQLFDRKQVSTVLHGATE